MKVLLVDDEYHKVQDIVQLCLTVDESITVEHVTTGYAARTRLRLRDFDLLLLDLHLPGAVGQSPSAAGGLELFDLLVLDRKSSMPPEICLISARNDVSDDVHRRLIAAGLLFVAWRRETIDWKSIVEGRVRLALERFRRRPRHFDVALITALPDPELSAVLELDYGWERQTISGDPTTYFSGLVTHQDRALSVVAVSTVRKGMPSAAALAMHVASRFSPRLLLMLGICAGVRGKVNYGDIVIGDPTWDWGAGKLAEDSQCSPVFLAAPHQMGLDPFLRQILTAAAADEDIRSAIRAGWKAATPEGELKIHIGPMASGASVIADRSSSDRIRAQNRDVIAIEMEAYALMATTEYICGSRPKVAAIKSICDFADPTKDDKWQRYAAYTSAKYADLVLRSMVSNGAGSVLDG